MPSLCDSVTFGLKPFSDSRRKRPNFGNIDLEHRRITMVQMWEIVGGADKGGIIVRYVEIFLMLSSALVLRGMLCFLFLFAPVKCLKLFLVVRDGENTKSNQLDDRLSTGALVEEIELKGDRLNYRLAVGTGPTTGWVFWLGGFGGSQICLFIRNLFLISSLQYFVDFFTDVERI